MAWSGECCMQIKLGLRSFRNLNRQITDLKENMSKDLAISKVFCYTGEEEQIDNLLYNAEIEYGAMKNKEYAIVVYNITIY